MSVTSWTAGPPGMEDKLPMSPDRSTPLTKSRSPSPLLLPGIRATSVAKEWVIDYHGSMPRICEPGCTCGRHKPFSPERRKKISEALVGKPLSSDHLEAMRCKAGCTC